MILYNVNYRGPLSNNEWSIVSIHKTLEGAKKAREQYLKNNKENNNRDDYEYCIAKINTDDYNDCVFNYNDIEEDRCVCYYKDSEHNNELEEDDD